MNDDQTQAIKVTALSGGRYLATWVDMGRVSSTLMARVMTADGKVPGEAFKLGQVAEFAGGYETKVIYSVTAEQNGGFAVAYEGQDIKKSANGVQTAVLTDVGASTYKAGLDGSITKAVTLAQTYTFDNAYIVSVTTLYYPRSSAFRTVRSVSSSRVAKPDSKGRTATPFSRSIPFRRPTRSR